MTRFLTFLRDERGSAIIEFLFVFPTVFLLFAASVESSVYMMKYAMFDRSIDIVVRNLRLGVYGKSFKHQDLKAEICKNGMMAGSLSNCLNAMKIWMQPIDTGSFAMGSTTVPCVDKAYEINVGEPVPADFATGTDNNIMLIRVCMKEWPMFPTTMGISIKMPVQSDGAVTMIVSSVFVNEPG
ncbi:MAG: hypothetical protein IT507_18385 [Burkholderiaceae bacterium]|jgi:hypothetical protein|nr:hypothetical protein [Burkholderiaceae bacterium]